MYALINTMEAAEGLTVGRVLSRHHTIEAAQAADARVQPRERNAYLPTIIAEIVDGEDVAKGEYVSRDKLVAQAGNTLAVFVEPY